MDCSGLTSADGADRDASRLQAEVFCSHLHVELDRLEQETEALKATLARQLARVELRRHAEITEGDLIRATSDRDRIVKMLEAMGHRYPCRHQSDGSLGRESEAAPSR